MSKIMTMSSTMIIELFQISKLYFKRIISVDLSQERLDFERPQKSVKQAPQQSHQQVKSLTQNKSYSDIFLKKKDINRSTSRDKRAKIQNINNKYSKQETFYENSNYCQTQQVQDASTSPNLFNLPTPKNNTRKINSSNSNSIDLSHLSQEKILSPKTNYKFENNILSRCKSASKLNSSIKTSKNCAASKKTNESTCTIESSCATSVNPYFQRRHTEAQEKLMRLKNEQIKKETQHIRDRPQISKNSKKIVENLIRNDGRKNSGLVFDRLTSKIHERKRTEEIHNIDELHKFSNKPIINNASEKLQRTIDDLYYWQKNLQEKRDKVIEENNSVINTKPQTLRYSEELLREKNPNYLISKVEDRLLDQGKMYSLIF